MVTKYAVPLTILFSYEEETKRWASLACEITVGSDGETLDEAREMTKDDHASQVLTHLRTSRLAHNLIHSLHGGSLLSKFRFPDSTR